MLMLWAVMLYRRRQSIPVGYYRFTYLSYALAIFQITVGLTFVLEGRGVNGFHLFYGIVVGLGVLGQALLGAGTPLGHRYRGRPLVYAFLALVVLGATFRAYLKA